MFLADQRAEGGRIVFGRSANKAFSTFFEAVDEFVKDRPFDIDALGAEANLTTIGENRAHGAFDSFIQITIGKNDRGVLTA